MNKSSLPKSFLLTEPAWYSYKVQNIYPDIISFVAAIPNHLRSLFIIPVDGFNAPIASERYVQIASKLSSQHKADYIPTGLTPEQGWFGTETFVNYDNENSHPDTSEGSIFDITDPYSRTKHQEYNFDQNVQVPTDTSYMSDVDMSEYFSYPYRLDAYPVRHSSAFQKHGALVVSEYLDSSKLVPWDSGLKSPSISDGSSDYRTDLSKKRYKVYYDLNKRAAVCSVEPKIGDPKKEFFISSTNKNIGYLERKFRVHCNLIQGGRGSRKFTPKYTQHNPGGYDVTVLERLNKSNRKAEFMITCDCEFFKYTDYHREMSGDSRRTDRPYVCKHVLSILQNTTNGDYLLLTSRSLDQDPDSVRDSALKLALTWLNASDLEPEAPSEEVVLKKRKRML